jgi:DNA polymerase-3 subunit beta
MKFILNSHALLKRLQALNAVISSNNTLPILDDFLFELRENMLVITASDLETTLVMNMETTMAENVGKVAINAKLLLEFIRFLPDSPISFMVDENTLGVEIVSSEGKYKLTGHNAEDYPELPVLNDATEFDISSQILSTAIAKTVFATGNDELRPAMGGVFFDIMPEYITFVATDAHKLVRYRRMDAHTEISTSFIVPRKPLNVLKTLLATEETTIHIEYTVINASFSYPGVKLFSRLIEGRYPAYEAVIPKDNPNHLTVHRGLFINSVKRLTPFANQSTHQVRLRITGQELIMNAEDIDFSNEGVERLECTYQGDDMEIGFNSKFLLEILNNMDTEEICIQLSIPTRAGIVVPAHNENPDEDILMLVMPVMLGSN